MVDETERETEILYLVNGLVGDNDEKEEDPNAARLSRLRTSNPPKHLQGQDPLVEEVDPPDL